jgi:large subunit ribosomal protein L23
MIIRPITSEKAVKLIDLENTLLFEADRKENKATIKMAVEKLFNVKVDEIRTHITKNKKFAYVKLKKENPAIDVATKLGMI